MVRLDEMCKFVHDDVVYDEHRSLDKTPVEIDCVIYSARAPTVPIVNDLRRRVVYAEITGVLFDATKDLFFGLRNIPIPQHIATPDRLKTMRMRLSAAYKGMNALLMKEGAQDFRSGQKFDHTIFFGENVDIHHLFPQEWCKQHGIKPAVFDSIINKTPLS
jgi:hypothetical protein